MKELNVLNLNFNQLDVKFGQLTKKKGFDKFNRLQTK